MTTLKTETFHRFKYAEEFAHELDRAGHHSWAMYRGEDERYEEDGEMYTSPSYVVEWATDD